MLTKILCCALISAIAAQSSDVPETTTVQVENQDLDELSNTVNVRVNGIVEKERLRIKEGVIGRFLTSLHDKSIEAIANAAHNFANEINAIGRIGNGTINALKNILDSKAKIIASIQKAGIKALGGLKQKEKKQNMP